MDHVDRVLLAQLQRDATQSYAALGQAAGLSAGAAHERVRKLRERGVIRRTTVETDPAALGGAVLAYVMVDSTSWMGDAAQDFAALPEILEAHIIAGSASVLVKVRTASTEQLQDVLRRIYAIDGISRTQATVVLETFFERPLSPRTPEQT
ncbi:MULTISPECIES: Lrp/AsnC family transcriptional regulator [unclassified Streptomyces]|uniref:Lrp/AsnC family transcriptional regulator n=1 Tax=unclassified Streptomyces TaxID=2593676 RepID=UPI000F5BCBE8|nr:Lrp/AsnC family transcriptional regulator [Streptomyces sp. ADI95-17]RPK74604.1 Regulatory protein AsnC [Streptomyces sp. ADI95-17]